MSTRFFSICAAAVLLAGCSQAQSGFPELDEWARATVARKNTEIGYPVNQDIRLKGFYEWYMANGLEGAGLNNVGDPFGAETWLLNAHKFERDVMEFFAPLYGFGKDDFWGIVTNSGTDGNNHGIYFGANYLYNKTGRMPVMYVSDEAHYSNMRLADLQNLDLRLIKSDDMGRMIPEELEKALDSTRPCLIVYAMGSTFKGAVDDQKALNAVLEKYPQMPVYRHVDAALFGGYLPFTSHRDMVDRNVMKFESIAVSGHKFFGMDGPAGIFITTREVYDNQDNFDISYLNADMKMINCSRSATDVLKFWWLINTIGYEQWCREAEEILKNTAYFKGELDKMGYPCWVNDLSNTIFLKRPSKEILDRYHLACSYDEKFGGELSHIVVMQHVNKERIDAFIKALKASMTSDEI